MANGNGALVPAGGRRRMMNPANLTPEQRQRWMARRVARAATSTLGRNQAPELIYNTTVTFAAPQVLQIPRTIPLNRPLESLTIVLRGRLVVGTADYTTGIPEAPVNLIENVRLSGTHRVFGNLTPLNLSGATLWIWPRLFQSKGNDVIISGTRAADPGRPYAQLMATVQGTYDFEVHYQLPLGPMLGPGMSTQRAALSYLYQPADWGDSLQLQITLGDRTSLGTPAGGSTTVWTGYGSAAGSPTVEVFANYSLLGTFNNKIRTGVVLRNEQVFTGFTALANATRISALQKQITTNVVIKSGTTLAGSTAGVHAFATLADTQLGRTSIIVDNKPVRNNTANYAMKGFLERQFNTIIPAGYLLLSFVDGKNAQLAYRGDALSGGSTFEVQSDILTAAATNRQQIVQEMIMGGPFAPMRV